MTRLLITGGCSITDQRTKDYEGGVITWPTKVANYMESELLNVAKRGRGNDYIENTVFDTGYGLAIDRAWYDDIFGTWTSTPR